MNINENTNELDAQTPVINALLQVPDAELLDAWTRDQLAEAFAVLVQRYGPMVLSVCRRKCRTTNDADDAYQTTFLLLAKNSGKISRPECLPGWLHRVAHRAAVATLSRNARHSDSTAEFAMADDPLDRIAQQHDANVLDEELSALPEHYRAALVMHVYEDCPLQKMADHFGTTLGSIRGRLQRGKQMLARRLRSRGVVPVLAVAAAGASMVNANEVAAANASLLSSIGSQPIPSPPISENLLHPLVASGKRIMTPWNTAAGIVAAGTVAAALLLPGSGSADGPSKIAASDRPVTLQAETEPMIAQFASETGGNLVGGVPSTTGAAAPQTITPAASGMGDSGMMGFTADTGAASQTGPGLRAGNETGPTMLAHRYRPATASGPVADALKSKMDTPVELKLSGSLESLAQQLENQLEQPVILSDRAIKYAKLDPSSQIQYPTRQEPLRTALRKMLQPFGLKATIETEALVITADHTELVHRGIGTNRWLNVDDEMMLDAESKLSETVNLSFIETPLTEAISQASQEIDLPIVIDRRALEEIGLDSDLPISANVPGMTAYDFLSYALADADLTLSVHNSLHTVTTSDAVERQLLGRVYWLEGLGMAGDYDSLMSLIETSTEPETWEALGGNSTMSPTPGTRPGLVINTTYDVHRRIDRLIQALRENSFALDAESELVEVPAPAPTANPNAFGGGGGGGGFM